MAVLLKDNHQVQLENGQVVIQVRIKVSNIFVKKEIDSEDAWVPVSLNNILQPFNLLDLHDNVAVLAAIGQVGSGIYEKVRLVLDQSDPSVPCIVLEGTTEPCIPLKVPSHKIDILLKPHILVPEGGTTSIVLDFAPGESIHIVQTDGRNEYILRPVIRAVTAEFPEGVRVHHELSGIITDCTPDTLTLSLRHAPIPVTIHYDSNTQLFSPEHRLLGNLTCAKLEENLEPNKKVEVKILAMNGMLYAVRVEIKAELPEIPEIEEFQVSGTLAIDGPLTVRTTQGVEYTVNFPQTVRVEGKLLQNQTVLAREIETTLVAEDFEVIGNMQPPESTLTLTDGVGNTYTIAFPPGRLIKVEGALTGTTITARESEVLP
jgi:hypothetical protein